MAAQASAAPRMLGLSIAAPRSYQEPHAASLDDPSTLELQHELLLILNRKLWFLSLKESVGRPRSQWRGDVSEGELAQEMTDRR
jgi:hypothetical protein